MNELIAGIVGAVIGAAASFTVSWFTLRFHYKQLFATTVSASRKRWIDTITDSFAQYFAAAEVLHGIYRKGNGDKLGNKVLELKQLMIRAERKITQRFTINDELQTMIKAAFLQMRDMIENSDNGKFAAACEYLEDLGRQLLKVEWNRVKRESSGKKH